MKSTHIKSVSELGLQLPFGKNVILKYNLETNSMIMTPYYYEELHPESKPC